MQYERQAGRKKKRLSTVTIQSASIGQNVPAELRYILLQVLSEVTPAFKCLEKRVQPQENATLQSPKTAMRRAIRPLPASRCLLSSPSARPMPAQQDSATLWHRDEDASRSSMEA